MKKIFVPLVVSACMLGSAQSVLAQYPDIPNDVKRKADSLTQAAYAHSDSAWALAKPIVEMEAAKFQRPYVPWAGRPTIWHRLPSRHFPVRKAVESLAMAAVAAKCMW